MCRSRAMWERFMIVCVHILNIIFFRYASLRQRGIMSAMCGGSVHP